MPSPAITGLILAGGQARRMGGRDKGLLPLSGRPLVVHVLERLAPQVDTIVISANRNLEAYEAFGVPVIADIIGGYAGPLAGLHAGLTRCCTPWLACVPCDAPLFPGDLVVRLGDALVSASASAAVACVDDRLEPTFLLCRQELHADLAACIATGQRSLHGWLARTEACRVSFADASAFANINAPGQLADLENAASS